jgi:hypothetical protein
MLGAEQAGWRSLLADNGITHVGMSYWSWRKRLPKKGVDIESYGFDSVLLESGGYQANSKPEQMSQGGWREYAEEYIAFVLEHIDDLQLVSEFDCLALGQQWIEEQRKTVWSQIDPQKFLPVWHPEQGLPELEHLGELYPRVAISEQAVTGHGLNVTPHLNALARGGVQLHGTAMTRPSVLRQVAFATAASTSWLSPMKFGDTICWDNNQLVRYPVKMKDQARRRHQALFEREGFDAQRILDDDKTEVTRLALWSWRQQEHALREVRGLEPAPVRRSSYEDAVDDSSEPGSALRTVGTQQNDIRNVEVAREPLQERPQNELVSLPMFGTRIVQAMNEKTREVEDIELLEVRGTSARRCDSCAIKSRCEEFKPNSTCAYSIPVVVKTKEQRAALLNGLIEMQAQRVQFGLLVEQVNGGYPDPNLSQEYDRLLKAMSTQADLEDNRDFLKISVEARGKTGALSRLFGGAAVERANPVQQLDSQETDLIAARVLDGGGVTTKRA